MLRTISMWTIALLALCESVGNAQDPYTRYQQAVESAKANRVGDNSGDKEEEGPAPPDKSEESWTEYKKVTRIKTQALEKMVFMDNTTGNVFPGAFLWADELRQGRLRQVSQIADRPSVKVVFADLRIKPETGAPPQGDALSFNYDGTFAGFSNGANHVLQGDWMASNRLQIDQTVSQSLDEALLKVGLSAKYWNVKLSSGLKFERSESRSIAVLTMDQVFYSVVTNTPPQHGYLPAELLRENTDLTGKLAQQVKEYGEIVYVRKVDYGRRLLIALSAEASEQELKTALKVSVDTANTGTEANLDARTKEVWKSIEGKLILIGGEIPDGVQNVFRGDPKGFFDAVKLITNKENLNFNAKSNVAVPISFTTAYVSDNAPMQVFETSTFSGKIPVRKFGKSVIKEKLNTDSTNAKVDNSDGEVDSDDWTKVELTRQNLRLSEDRRTLYVDLLWKLYEGEKDKTVKMKNGSAEKTVIVSSRTFEFTQSKPIKEIVSVVAPPSKEEWYRGKVHRSVPFPNHGNLSNISVRFDGEGRNDVDAQMFAADLNVTVWLED